MPSCCNLSNVLLLTNHFLLTSAPHLFSSRTSRPARPTAVKHLCKLVVVSVHKLRCSLTSHAQPVKEWQKLDGHVHRQGGHGKPKGQPYRLASLGGGHERVYSDKNQQGAAQANGVHEEFVLRRSVWGETKEG